MTNNLTILLLVTFVAVCVTDDLEISLLSHSDLETKGESFSSNSQPEVCQYVEPKIPDFNAPGRRISQAKCYEYIWNIKYRIDEEERHQKCMEVSPALEIIGGQIAKPGEFPHMGAIGWKAIQGTWIFMCGGTLISPKFLLTAAHCTSASSRDTRLADVVPKIIRLGDKSILDKPDRTHPPPMDEKIIRIIKHDQYASPKKYYDIALMEFEFEVLFTRYLQPACLWTNPDDNSYMGQVTVAGWGVVDAGGSKTSPELQTASLDMVNKSTCEDLLRPSCNRLFCGLQDHQLCAGKLDGGVDTCQGDSGGPLQIKIALPKATKQQGKMYYVIGVTSFGIGCARANTPGVYTKVASFLDWIESIVWA